MNLDLYPHGTFQIIKVKEDLSVISELSELRAIIEGYLAEGKVNIAVSFTNASYIYSGAIAVLIQCYKKVKDGKGILCVIEPQKEIKNIFHYLGIDKFIPLFDSLSELPL